MDESWRMRMGMNLPRRRSTEETSSGRIRRGCFALDASDSETLNPEDFNDVFGGPPRSIFSRQFSGNFTAGNRSDSFFEEIFQSPDTSAPTKKGRNLPVFRIPATRGGGGVGTFRLNEGFYDDIFGSDEDRRSRSRSKSKPNSKSKSKSNSSSVLSSEDLSPLRPSVAEDVAFSSFASKLRPINVPCRRNSSSTMPEEQQNIHGISAIPCTRPSYMDFQLTENNTKENFRSSYFGFSRRTSSPEAISIEPSSYQSIKISVDDIETDSPSSVVSSLCRESEAKARTQEKTLHEEEEEEEDEEVMSSYVIEITSDKREGTDEAVAIDEAIAWAKEKFLTPTSEELESGNQKQNVRLSCRDHFAEREERITHKCLDQHMDGNGRMLFLEAYEEPKKWTMEEELQQTQKDVEQLEEDVRLWSAGKEGNIRLLLSTLHHILWPDSGWYAMPLTDLIETSQVKKAYQRVRLCLHPDKLQQRGATSAQKYVAGKAFAILQDAWTAFISQDILFC